MTRRLFARTNPRRRAHENRNPLSASSAAARCRPCPARQPGRDGIDAHEARIARQRRRARGRLLRGAGAGRHRADRDRGLRAQPLRPDGRGNPGPRQPRQGEGAQADHGSGPPARHQNLPADPPCRALRAARGDRRPVAGPDPDQQGPAPRAERGGGRGHRRGFRAQRRSRPRGGIRRRRGDGLRRLPDHPVLRLRDQPARRRLGRRLREPHPLPRRDRPPDPRTRRRRLPADLPYFGARSGRGRADRRRDGGARPRGGRCGRRHPVVRHRLARGPGADHREGGSARRLGPVRRPAQARGRDPHGGLQPHQRARDRRGDPGGGRCRPRRARPAPPRRPRLRRQGGGGEGRPDQHLHRLQPGLPRPDLPVRYRDLPGKSGGLQRVRQRCRSPGFGKAGGGRGRRSGRPRRGGGGGRERATR